MILVTGGAGYIGSHMVKLLLKHKFKVVVLDDLSTGNRKAVPDDVPFIMGDLKHASQVKQVFQEYPISAVMHFAAKCYVGESVEQPSKYYNNNLLGLINLLDVMVESNVYKVIFSSSCAVYGVPAQHFIKEDTTQRPISAYGRTKLFCEEIIKDYSIAYGLNYIFLRYFNVAGADTDGELGEDHQPETHLIPNILKHLQGQTQQFNIYGVDYPTPDGTCIRDYIHVTDLVNGHLTALSMLLNDKVKNDEFNLGRGAGYSIKEILHTCEQITNKQANIHIDKRRPGDPAKLIANAYKAENVLKWKASLDLEDMIRTAWKWFTTHPNGY
ncbi:UDP-glucose 4-epimerase GalE [Pseudalkalibacillus berkeleyi]|uniref:UDP-glucose 4-epimerase n=1 Tax=Pseudalkalibacillus berkeleyi TaxID=1069813 RepID=A0ABS9GYX5_9BACL|nr:UDP-glucose 4-epimerase GalE [Pseudalkalibacillus berkeleyi]MCF6136881.1 UDP-glucose 4-epimerase GalE [Pseudalkalibacillus berkeleyi]